MNLAALHHKLIAAAKSNPPSDKVPYAFEKRILAHIRSSPVADAWAEWAASLWRAAVPCFCLMMLLAGWALYTPHSIQPVSGLQALNPSPDLSQQMESTVLAAAVQEQGTDSVW